MIFWALFQLTYPLPLPVRIAGIESPDLSWRVNATADANVRDCAGMRASAGPWLQLVSQTRSSSPTPAAVLNTYGRGRVLTHLVPLADDVAKLNMWQYGLRAVAQDTAPVVVTGDVEYMFARTPSAWLVTLINNKGVTKRPGEAAQVGHWPNVIRESCCVA